MNCFVHTFFNDNETVFRLAFAQEIHRVDIRKFDHGYPTKDGVILNSSDFKFVNGYIMNNFEKSSKAHYRVCISKQDDQFVITKKDKGNKVAGVAIEAKTWKERIYPMVAGLLYLLETKDLPKNQLIDLWLMTRKYNKDEMLGPLKPLDVNNTMIIKFDLEKCFLLALNICNSFDILRGPGRMDLKTLVHFRESDNAVFASLLEFYY